jgi:hypothetical protein
MSGLQADLVLYILACHVPTLSTYTLELNFKQALAGPLDDCVTAC